MRRDALSLGLPFVVRATAAGQPWRLGGGTELRGGFTREALLRACGNLTVSHGQIPYARRYGQRGYSAPLHAFVEAHMSGGGGGGGGGGATPQYIFDASVLTANEALFEPLVSRLAALFPDLAERAYLRQFIVGPPLSGSHMHYHGRAANLLVVGVKLWLFSPPGCAHFSTAQAAPWVRALHGREPQSPAVARLLACHAALGVPLLRVLQAPGDIVVVPESWAHAVLNLADTVAIALEG